MIKKIIDRIIDWYNRRPVIKFEYKIKKVDFHKMNFAERDNVFNLLMGAYYIYMEQVHNQKNKETIYEQTMKARGILELYTELKSIHDNEISAIEKAQREAYENDIRSKKKSIL